MLIDIEQHRTLIGLNRLGAGEHTYTQVRTILSSELCAVLPTVLDELAALGLIKLRTQKCKGRGRPTKYVTLPARTARQLDALAARSAARTLR